jgi:glycosyltransferase involved in cell wall biosynthesis
MLPHMQSKNGEKLKVSVIICTLDKNRILPGTIPSIKRSPLVDELIIVEGEFKPIGYARNVGWKKAKNPLICFIDDDEVVPDG